MFGFTKTPATTVPGILSEGRDWVTRLSTAATATEKEALEMDKEVTALSTAANATHAEAAEGKAVADNFKDLLRIKK